MDKSGNEFVWNFSGEVAGIIHGVSDPDFFSPIVENRAFLPVLLTEQWAFHILNTNSFVTCDALNVMENIGFEHLGNFITAFPLKEVLPSRVKLISLVAIAQHACGLPIGCAAWPICDSLVDRVDFPGSERELLAIARELIFKLVPLLGTVAVPCERFIFKPAEVLNWRSSHKQYAERLYANILGEALWMPYNIYTGMCKAYTELYSAVYPSICKHVIVAVQALCMDDFLALETIVRVYSPIFVPQLKTIEEIIESLDDEDDKVNVQHLLSFKLFTGFEVSVEEKKYELVPESCFDFTEYFAPNVSVGTQGFKKHTVYSLETCAIRLVQKYGVEKRFANDCVREKLFVVDACVAAPKGSLGGEVYESYIRTLQYGFTATAGAMLLQAGVFNMHTAWRVADCNVFDTANGNVEAVLNKLTQKYVRLFLSGHRTAITSSSNNDWGILVLKNVCFGLGPAYGHTTMGTTNFNAATGRNGSILVNAINGRCRFTAALRDLYGHVSGNVPEGITENIPITGLWSVYNSSGFTEYANLSTLSQPGGACMSAISDFTDCTKVKNEYKIKIGYAPNSALQMLAVLKTAMVSSIASLMVLGSSTFDGELTCIEDARPQKLFIAGLRNWLERKTFVKLPAPQADAKSGTVFRTSQMEQQVAQFTSQVFMCFNSKSDNASEFNLDALDWLADENKTEGMSRRMTGLIETFNIKDMIKNVVANVKSKFGNGVTLYFRPYFYTVGPVRYLRMLTKKSEYNNAVVTFYSNWSCITVNANFFSTVKPAKIRTGSANPHHAFKFQMKIAPSVYSKATIASWVSSGSGNESALMINVNVSVMELLKNICLENTCEDFISYDILNRYELQESVYVQVVERLKAMQKFVEEGTPEYYQETERVREDTAEQDNRKRQLSKCSTDLFNMFPEAKNYKGD